MIQGLYAAASGMIALEDRQSVIANNIANSATVGYKRQNAVTEGFNELFLGKLGTQQRLNAAKGPGGGLRVSSTYTDLKNGPLLSTGDPMNVALVGPGFFGVQTPGGERFTRSGSFIVDTEGQLATADGFKVEGDGGGLLDVAGGKVQIDGNGAVTVDNQLVGRLQVVEFENPEQLEHAGANVFSAPASAAKATTVPETHFAPGMLEGSNVQTPVEMADMLLGLRAYTANQKVINSVDDTVSRLISDVGTPV